jgi:hypothetical protein
MCFGSGPPVVITPNRTPVSPKTRTLVSVGVAPANPPGPPPYGDCHAKQNAPDSVESRDAIVEQSSPENCSHTPYVLIPIDAIARRNALCVT